MKLIYSHLQKLLPDLNKDPAILRDDLTMIGHFTNYYEQIENEIVFDLDIKVNRGDCLSYYGLAKDLSVYYKLPLVLPEISSLDNLDKHQNPLDITINSPDVTRVQALSLSGLKNSPSPEWLSKFLRLHEINSINTIVDITNYVMLIFGIPSHAFDIKKTGPSLTWENNHSLKYSTFTTLDKTQLKIDPETLLISNQKEALSLSFIGGANSGIKLDTTDSIIEMAIYSRSRVRTDSRKLKTITEASLRLEKDLDPDTLPLAFSYLSTLLKDLCQANISSSLFDHYPQKETQPEIKLDITRASQIAGIDIPKDFTLQALKDLGCHLQEIDSNNYLISPPSIRKDITQEEDLLEEIIRFWGYQHIPSNHALEYKKLPDITPKVLYLIEETKEKLVSLGYDEILSWPLVQEALNEDTAVKTQNSINSEYPILRQSIIQSLKTQVDQYQRLKVPQIQIFEIGKIYNQNGKDYKEEYALALYHQSPEQLKKDLQALGFNDYKIEDDNYAQVILSNIDLPKDYHYQPKEIVNQAIELNGQIITLDANITLDDKKDPASLIKEYQSKIDPSIFWSMQITDIYHDSKNNKYRYTFRVSYYNTDDKTAKKAHLDAFDLN